jgi:hypothetical protein
MRKISNPFFSSLVMALSSKLRMRLGADFPERLTEKFSPCAVSV